MMLIILHEYLKDKKRLRLVSIKDNIIGMESKYELFFENCFFIFYRL